MANKPIMKCSMPTIFMITGGKVKFKPGRKSKLNFLPVKDFIPDSQRMVNPAAIRKRYARCEV